MTSALSDSIIQSADTSQADQLAASPDASSSVAAFILDEAAFMAALENTGPALQYNRHRSGSAREIISC